MFKYSVSRYVSVFAFILIFAGSVRAEQDIRLLANTSPPYAGAGLPDQGLAVELVRHIFTRTDYTPEITIENWSRAVEGARIGVYDALASVWYSPEREQDLLFSKSYLESDLILLKLRYASLDELAGGRLGVRRDYAYGIDFDGIPDLVQVEEDLLVSNLLNLLAGKVDFVIADQRTATMQLHELLNDKINQVQVMGIALPPVKRHIAAARSWPGHEAMIAAFDRALVSTQDDGSLQSIITKWNERYADVQ